jgi:hypothetical protein
MRLDGIQTIRVDGADSFVALGRVRGNPKFVRMRARARGLSIGDGRADKTSDLILLLHRALNRLRDNTMDTFEISCESRLIDLKFLTFEMSS